MHTHGKHTLLTTASVFAPYGLQPLTNEQAWAVLHELQSDDRVVFATEEPSDMESCWERFSTRSSTSPKVFMDAYLAAFAWSGGYQLVTLDRAFHQFDELDCLII